MEPDSLPDAAPAQPGAPELPQTGSAPAAPPAVTAPDSGPDSGAAPAAEAGSAPSAAPADPSAAPAGPSADASAGAASSPAATGETSGAADALQAPADGAATAVQQGADAATAPQAATQAGADAAGAGLPGVDMPDMPADGGALADPIGLVLTGGPAMWAIAALSVLTLALILWKLWRFAMLGIWRRQRADIALRLWHEGRSEEALETVRNRPGIPSRFVHGTMVRSRSLPDAAAREQTESDAMDLISEARSGLRALDLIATIAPLLGLLGTVLGMISAFQALQESGARADPSALAGGIWEALLTTAAGMAVAIPATAAGSWFEAIIARLGRDMERAATLVFTRAEPETEDSHRHAGASRRMAAE